MIRDESVIFEIPNSYVLLKTKKSWKRALSEKSVTSTLTKFICWSQVILKALKAGTDDIEEPSI